MILTDKNGRPYTRPVRSDFSSDVAFIRAVHTHNDRIAAEANRAFDDQR